MRALYTFLILMLLALLASCKPSPSTPATPGDAAVAGKDAAPEPVALDGATLYSQMCAVCHAPDGTGYKADNAPSLVNRTFLESAPDAHIRRSIAEGRPGTSMAAYGKDRGGPLDDAAIARITEWIRGHGPAPMPMLARAAGDATRGSLIYKDKCERCHGNATTRATAVHLANPRFLDVASDPFLAYAITEGRPGTPMTPWKGTLTDAQIDDVVAYVRSFAKPAAAGSLPAPTGNEPLVINPNGKAPSFTPRSSPCPPNSTGAPCVPDQRFVSIDQVKQALAEKRKMIIIDARPPSDWMRVHIPGAVSIPYHDMKRLADVPNDGTWVIAYCACPHHLSGEVVDTLRKRGLQHAVVLDEGILEWHRRGYPVIAAPGVEPPPPVNANPLPSAVPPPKPVSPAPSH